MTEHAMILAKVDSLIAPYEEPEKITQYDMDTVRGEIEDILVTQQRRMQKRNLALENANNSFIDREASDDNETFNSADYVGGITTALWFVVVTTARRHFDHRNMSQPPARMRAFHGPTTHARQTDRGSRA